MNWTKASAVAEILSSVAILITLVYLVVEIGQNTSALEASSRQAALDGDVEWLYRAVNAPELWANASNPDMTDAEKLSLSAYLFALYRLRERDWLQYQAGALDEATWLTYQNGLIGMFSNPQARKWWDYQVSDGGSDFIDHVNGVFEDIPLRTEQVEVRAFD